MGLNSVDLTFLGNPGGTSKFEGRCTTEHPHVSSLQHSLNLGCAFKRDALLSLAFQTELTGNQCAPIY